MLAVASLKRSLEFDPVEQGVKRKRAELKLPPTSFPSSSSSSSPSKQQSAVFSSSSSSLSSSSNSSQSSPKSSSSSPPPASVISTDDAPMFTYNQTAQMCARFLREQEKSIREQYGELLTAKLNEQYEQFIRYSHDSVYKDSSKQNKLFHFGQSQELENSSTNDFSYVS